MSVLDEFTSATLLFYFRYACALVLVLYYHFHQGRIIHRNEMYKQKERSFVIELGYSVVATVRQSVLKTLDANAA